jgi:hypothetical protein
MVALNLDDALLGSSTGAAMPLERFCDFGKLAFFQPGNHTHRTASTPLAHDANDAVVGYAWDLPLKRRHAALLRQARARALPNGLGDEPPYLCFLWKPSR